MTQIISKLDKSGGQVKSIFLALFLFSTSSLNFNYELIDFSKSEIYEQEKLLKMVSKEKEELVEFKCDNPARYLLFTKTIHTNQKNDSLKIRSRRNKLYTYKNSKLFFKGKAYKPRKSETFLNQFLSAVKKIKKTTVGKLLIQSLMSANEDFIVKKGWSHFEPNYENERAMWHINEAGFAFIMDEQRPRFGDKTPFKKIGSGGKIFWNPNMKAQFIESDYIKRTILPELVLAHEMYHAYDSIRGLMDRRLVNGEDLEFIEATEYRAVFFENQLRKELGLKYRRYYSSVNDFSKPDLLTDENEPIFIPSPCINWL